MTEPRPILFFDSGMGGLSVMAPTARLLPRAPLVYVADSAGYPYGTRSEAEIAARVPALLGRLAERTGGATARINEELIVANAALGALVACALTEAG
jgi:glutamate racemase